jgi:3-deoxy-D-manno-octulosonate 8-phosphate phosphatase (KDO 8-P phosphatase)
MFSLLGKRLSRIEGILLDVDGVLTDGTLVYDDRGGELRAFSVKDGYGIARAVRAGIVFGIVTGRTSPIVDRRAAELGIRHVWQGVGDKLALLPEIERSMGLAAERLLFIGDDAPDARIMGAVGCSACPADASPEGRFAARIVARACGGRGAVREIVDRVLVARGLLDPRPLASREMRSVAGTGGRQ